MIRHIVFFSVTDAAKRPFVHEQLLRLGQIPGAKNFAVNANLKVDGFDNTVDLVVYGEFESTAALAAYKAHPVYVEITAIVRPLRELRFAADVEASGESISQAA